MRFRSKGRIRNPASNRLAVSMGVPTLSFRKTSRNTTPLNTLRLALPMVRLEPLLAVRVCDS
ncbi:MAG: hypothetical protein BWY72_02406 [Bacteroidetes bacterium ADurb.Bin416]|nr:MAG: hypothetical protein BWY72_02406 [Bacteroidetes bacterium ADurb.Bin416]